MTDGFLSIWSDIPAEDETDYLHWLTREHASERLGVPGFLRVGVYRALNLDVRRYFIRYELALAGVLTSAGYLERLNSPTPWSRRIMPKLLNFVRGGGKVAGRAGAGSGGFLGVLKLPEVNAVSSADVLGRMVQIDRIVSAELLETDKEQTSVATREKSLRQGDGSFDGLLLVHGLDETPVKKALESIRASSAGNIYGEVFRQ